MSLYGFSWGATYPELFDRGADHDASPPGFAWSVQHGGSLDRFSSNPGWL
jgi:hypothetical protein